MSLIEPIDVLEPRLRELLPDSVEVHSKMSAIDLGAWEVSLYDTRRNLAMNERIGSHEFYDMVERDGTGWDSYGVHGIDAKLLTAAMFLDPHYKVNPHRIPKLESGWRLNERGEYWCRRMAEEFDD